MLNTTQVQNLFPAEYSIPGNIKIDSIVDQSYYLINGRIEEWDGPMKIVYSPVYFEKKGKFERKIIGKHPLLDKNAALNVLKYAESSYNSGRGSWAVLNIEKRIECMNSFLEGLKSKKVDIIRLLMWEIGKPFHEAEKEFERTIDNISETIDNARQIGENSSKIQTGNNIHAKIKSAPVGVVLCMGPFNYPLNESFATIIPALLMGNSVIFKPPKYGVFVFQPVLKLFRDCFPSGVFNTLYGKDEEVIIPLLNTGRIDMLAFIGTSKAANILHSQHPKPNRLKEVLGLEAKNPAVIFEDVNVEWVVKQCIEGAPTFNGQRCTALKILFVHSAIIDNFLKELSEAVERLIVGMPWDENVMITPIPDTERVKYLQSLIEDACRKGARILNDRGGRTDKSIVFPTILYPVDSSMKIFHEEQFGPLIPVVAYDDIKEPIQHISQSSYGQQVSIFGHDSSTIEFVVNSLIHQTARVNLNTICQRGPDKFPFTGRKDSAKSVLSVKDALREFSLPAIIAEKDAEESLHLF
ncbi:MAG: aldehyde dehydrogenase family protein [Bacteroidota bacterium]